MYVSATRNVKNSFGSGLSVHNQRVLCIDRPSYTVHTCCEDAGVLLSVTFIRMFSLCGC